MMRIFIDIDGVLAFCNVPVLAHVCNDAWQLNISQERLATVRRLEDFEVLPEVATRRNERSPERFDNELAWMHFDASMLDADIVASGAVEGVQRLAQIGDVAYLTARHVEGDDARCMDIANATRRWLREHCFVNADCVTFCHRIAGKVSMLITIARATDELLVLIDDSAARIVELINHLDDDDRNLLYDRLVLVAFAQPRPNHGRLRTLRMPHWNVEPVARCFVEEEQGHATLRSSQRSA